jgi:hypothetical protein
MGLRAGCCLCAALCLGLGARAASGDDGAISRERLPLFSISKSENKNQVLFEVRLDTRCRPIGDAPVVSYWRMLERSTESVEPLLSVEGRAYGIGRQQILDRGDSGGTVRFALRALPGREIVVRATREGSTCLAEASTLISSTPARLYNVHVRLAWPFGIDSLLITGRAQSDGHIVRETLRP